MHYLLNDFKTALISLNNAQLINENSNKVYIMKAMCYISVGNIKKAKEEIESVRNESLEAKEIDKMKKMGSSSAEMKEAIERSIGSE